MRVALLGRDTELKRAVAAELARQGDAVAETAPHCLICLSPDLVDRALEIRGIERLVLRSFAYVYGSSTKNPGLMTEERVSLLPPGAPELRWLEAEEKALRFGNTAIVRLANVLSAGEGDLLVKQIARRAGISLACHDPNVQFVSVRDAARTPVAAAASTATGGFNAAGAGTIPLRKAYRAAGTERIPILGGVKLD